MKKFKSINFWKYFILIGLLLISIVIVGGSFAYYVKILFNDLHVSTITKGLDYYITYSNGQNINLDNFVPVTNFYDGAFTTVSLSKKDNTYDIYGQIYLDVSEIGVNLKSSSALKYKITSDQGFSREGTFLNTSSGSSILVAKNIPLTTTSRTFTVYIWLDENEEINPNAMGERLGISVRCEATMIQI